jgi:general stress protein 26
MDNEKNLETKFWKALSSDRTVMLGIDGVEDGHSRPMTAMAENDTGPIWFFTSKDNGIVKNLDQNRRAVAAFTAKNHDLFASIHGNLHIRVVRRQG